MDLRLVLFLGGCLSLVMALVLLLIPRQTEQFMERLLELFWGRRAETMMIRTPRLGGWLLIVFGVFLVGASLFAGFS